MTGVWLEGWEAVRSWFLEVMRFTFSLTVEAHQREGSQESSQTRSGFFSSCKIPVFSEWPGEGLRRIKFEGQTQVGCSMHYVWSAWWSSQTVASSLPTLWVLEVKVTCLSWLSCVLHLIWEILSHRTPDTCVWVNGMCIRGSFGKWPVG